MAPDRPQLMGVASPPSAVILGCGYVGRRLQLSLGDSAQVLGVSRHRPDLHSPWLELDLDTDPLAELLRLCEGSVLYYFVAPSTQSARDERSRRFIAALTGARRPPSSVVLISTTGVYGDCGGAWVDESFALNPGSDRAKRRVDAESAWTAAAEQLQFPLAILRVAGIYGPGKLPLSRLHSGQPLLRVSQSPWSNRVHVDDLVATAVAAAGQGLIANVADGSPSSMSAYFHALADAVGVPRLAEADRDTLAAQWSSALRSYMSESRRIDNSRMRALLGGQLRYPSLAEGLAASVQPQ